MARSAAWLDDFVYVTAVVCGLFDGLAHLHRHGVLHRDLAPRNILFDVHGRRVLCDFGLSRLTQDGGKVHERELEGGGGGGGGIDGDLVAIGGCMAWMVILLMMSCD